MEIKDLIGAAVAHKIFGQGVVESAWDNYIEVTFIKILKDVNFLIHLASKSFLN